MCGRGATQRDEIKIYDSKQVVKLFKLNQQFVSLRLEINVWQKGINWFNTVCEGLMIND